MGGVGGGDSGRCGYPCGSTGGPCPSAATKRPALPCSSAGKASAHPLHISLPRTFISRVPPRGSVDGGVADMRGATPMLVESPCSTSSTPPAAMANSKEKLEVALVCLGQVGKNK
jgi:hypothetical protein